MAVSRKRIATEEGQDRIKEAILSLAGNSEAIGNLAELTTKEKESLVLAINELDLGIKSNLHVYNGRNLVTAYADEIAEYANEWAWIQDRLDTHHVEDLRAGDYIPIVVGSETHFAEIAGINTYYNTGDNGYIVGYHIDWITRDCYSATVQWNTTNNNNGTEAQKNPFLSSNLKSWLDGTLYPLLETKLKNVIKSKRVLAPYRYQAGQTLTDDNSWGWESFDKLWVPFEHEVFDSIVWSTKGYGNGQAVTYELFANSYTHRVKGAGPNGSRTYWWLASSISGGSTHVVSVDSCGHSHSDSASYAYRVPVCFRTMETA